MKKIIFPTLGLLLALGATQSAYAQVNFIRMGMNAATLAKRASKAKAQPEAIPLATYQGQSFPMQRTSADLMPKKGAEQVVALETELDRCHAALLASPSATICTPEQQAALQTALRNLAKIKTDNLPVYQQEATFYVAENTRRQQATTPAPATN